jgi:hypothetical protein
MCIRFALRDKFFLIYVFIIIIFSNFFNLCYEFIKQHQMTFWYIIYIYIYIYIYVCVCFNICKILYIARICILDGGISNSLVKSLILGK